MDWAVLIIVIILIGPWVVVFLSWWLRLAWEMLRDTWS